ncbi:MAG: hypothetical protein ACNA7Y_04295, partial [Gammaproteobacteria bacterium]
MSIQNTNTTKKFFFEAMQNITTLKNNTTAIGTRQALVGEQQVLKETLLVDLNSKKHAFDKSKEAVEKKEQEWKDKLIKPPEIRSELNKAQIQLKKRKEDLEFKTQELV